MDFYCPTLHMKTRFREVNELAGAAVVSGSVGLIPFPFCSVPGTLLGTDESEVSFHPGGRALSLPALDQTGRTFEKRRVNFTSQGN